MHDLVFLPIIVFALTAIGAVMIGLAADYTARKRVTRRRPRAVARRPFRPVVVQNDAATRVLDGKQEQTEVGTLERVAPVLVEFPPRSLMWLYCVDPESRRFAAEGLGLGPRP